MFRRVALIVAGIVIGLTLRKFGVDSEIAAVLAAIPFGLNEAWNMTGPYEKTAHEIMHEHDDSAATTSADPKVRD